MHMEHYKVGGSHEHGREVHAVLFFTRVFASTVNRRAAICEHASPKPAIQVQCAHTTIPCCSTATQGFTGVADNFFECLTRAVIK